MQDGLLHRAFVLAVRVSGTVAGVASAALLGVLALGALASHAPLVRRMRRRSAQQLRLPLDQLIDDHLGRSRALHLAGRHAAAHPPFD